MIIVTVSLSVVIRMMRLTLAVIIPMDRVRSVTLRIPFRGRRYNLNILRVGFYFGVMALLAGTASVW